MTDIPIHPSSHILSLGIDGQIYVYLQNMLSLPLWVPHSKLNVIALWNQRKRMGNNGLSHNYILLYRQLYGPYWKDYFSLSAVTDKI